MLQYVHRYRIGLAECISEVLFESKPCGHVLRKLAAGNLLELNERGITGNISYVTLAKKGFEKIGIDDAKPKTISNTVLNTAIALSWYCNLESSRRFLMIPSEVREVFGKTSTVPHILCPAEFGQPVVLRVYHATGKLKTAKNKTEEFFETTASKPRFAPALANRDFGLLCLAPTGEKRNQLSDAFHKEDLFSRGLLVVGLGPTEETLAKLLRERRSGREQSD